MENEIVRFFIGLLIVGLAVLFFIAPIYAYLWSKRYRRNYSGGGYRLGYWALGLWLVLLSYLAWYNLTLRFYSEGSGNAVNASVPLDQVLWVFAQFILPGITMLVLYMRERIARSRLRLRDGESIGE